MPALKIAYSEATFLQSEKERIRNCLAEIDTIHPEIIVLTGHSRGASACIELAREIYLAHDDNIKVHMNIYDPVPGHFRHEESKKVIPPNVQSLVITCAGYENDIILKVQNMNKLSFDTNKTSATVLVLPTYHNDFPDTIKKISTAFWKSIKQENEPKFTRHNSVEILPYKPLLPLEDDVLYIHKNSEGVVEIYPGNNTPKTLTVHEIEKLNLIKWFEFPKNDQEMKFVIDENESNELFIKNIVLVCGYSDLEKTEFLNDADIADRRKNRIYSMTSIAPLTKDNESVVHFHQDLAYAANIPKNVIANVTKNTNTSTSTTSSQDKSESVSLDDIEERKQELERIYKQGHGFKNVKDKPLMQDINNKKNTIELKSTQKNNTISGISLFKMTVK